VEDISLRVFICQNSILQMIHVTATAGVSSYELGWWRDPERVRVTAVWSGEDMGEARQYLRSVICRLGQRACGIVLQFTVYAVSFQLNSVFLVP
jgi:hypothetical protein